MVKTVVKTLIQTLGVIEVFKQRYFEKSLESRYVVNIVHDASTEDSIGRTKTAVAIDRYLLPAPDLSSKPAGRRGC